jgi:tRNA(adenine34) deaminase
MVDGPVSEFVNRPDDPADERIMEFALAEAERCLTWGDVPIGAVVARDGVVIGVGGNRREADQDPTAHAEMVAIRQAAQALGSWRLSGCSMYVTLEPCAMCAGALVLARIDRLVFSALDPKAGFVGSLGDLVRDARLNHRLDVTNGVLADRAATLLRAFFEARR